MQNKISVKKIFIYIIPIMILIFNLIILTFPNEIVQAAKQGLLLWFNVVLPSLFPFMVGTNLLMNLGFSTFLGTLLEPLMLKIFSVSGSGAFVLISGMTSGYPMGAKVTTDLYINKQLNKTEAQRLLGFTNNSGPLFVIGTVGLGMFKSESIGYFILLIHYISSLMLGFIFRFYKYKDKKINVSTKNQFKKAVNNLYRFRENNNASFGILFGNSVKDSLESIAVVGGFIIVFSVLVKILSFINFDTPIITGILEITNGCNLLAKSGINSNNIILASAIISWGGFSIHAQAISFISKTDLSIFIYIISKALHCLLSILLSYLLLPFFNFNTQTTSVFNIISPIQSFAFSFLLFLFSILLPLTIGLLMLKRTDI